MKFITAVIRPNKLDDVREALSEAGVSGLTVTEVKDFGRQLGHTELYRGAEYQIEFRPKIKVEVAVRAQDAQKIVEAVTAAAATGKVGDGKIFVRELEQVVRIRTTKAGEVAL